MRGRPVFVDVFADLVGGAVKFSHEWRFEGGPSQGGGAIQVPHGTPRSPIHFKLHDKTGRQLRFFDDPQDAIWAKIDQCPGAKGGGGQIDFTGSVSAGSNLKVHNLNSAKCELHYALWFKDKDDKVETYDPVIRNGGGGP